MPSGVAVSTASGRGLLNSFFVQRLSSRGDVGLGEGRKGSEPRGAGENSICSRKILAVTLRLHTSNNSVHMPSKRGEAAATRCLDKAMVASDTNDGKRT